MKSKMKLLRGSDLLDMHSQESIFHDFKQKKYDKGNLIAVPDSNLNSVFIVHSGQLRVYLSYGGREFTLRFLEKGDVFTTHTRAFITAVSNAELWFVNTNSFHDEVTRKPEISLVITEILGELLASSWDVIEGLLFQDVKSRLIAFLISLGKERGKKEGVSLVFDCHLTIEDIAMVIGSSRQTTSSLLNELIKNGYIVRPEKNEFFIPDYKKLEAGLLRKVY